MTDGVTEPEKTCQQCAHDFGPHSMIATTGNPMDGGIMLCPEPGCVCFSTWGAQGGPAKYIPDRFELEEIREYVQASK